ncbi:olfactory receptor 5P56-like [Macrotis lagotis]|uniref:olfactory receptor 5P56-like n=1 Tax=Macrotis lagotis TaxID=92651 RepID=UPI003D68D767
MREECSPGQTTPALTQSQKTRSKQTSGSPLMVGGGEEKEEGEVGLGNSSEGDQRNLFASTETGLCCFARPQSWITVWMCEVGWTALDWTGLGSMEENECNGSVTYNAEDLRGKHSSKEYYGRESLHGHLVPPTGTDREKGAERWPLHYLLADLLSDCPGGNLGVTSLICTNPQLHPPMYFFLSILSFLDFSYSTINTPRLRASFLTRDRSISSVACVTQLLMMTIHGTAECLLLAVMAYDRFVAICHPLLYHAIMSHRLCMELAALPYAVGAANAVTQTGNIFRLPFCGPNIIDHYFCDLPPVLQLACGDKAALLILFLSSSTIILSTVSIILVSSTYTLVTIYRMHSLEAQRKAFSTCASHLTAISLFYGTIIFMYAQPSSRKTSDQNKVVSVFYTIVIPMLNPLIYSLRNKDVKTALRKKFLGKTQEKS